mmetsp:Transcript_31935/g.48587  ORF Transcript_31935/g.48587 Transcript_31935/m.48587 type:complete len:341 (+) Transcript_31935:49-1071(+)
MLDMTIVRKSNTHKDRRRYNCTKDEKSLFKALPPDIVTDILISFCDGKVISTFYLAACKSDYAAYIVGNALKQRFHKLSENLRQRDPGQISDSLVAVLQQITHHFQESHKGVAMKLLSECCAILDYFEAQLLLIDDALEHWLIWCGVVESFYGPIKVYVTSPYWSANAVDDWYHELELSHLSLERPQTPLEKPPNLPFGSIAGQTITDAVLIDRLQVNLNDAYQNNNENGDYWKGMLTASQFCYDEPEAPLILTTHIYPTLEKHDQFHRPKWLSEASSLCCYWQTVTGCDDDSAQHRLGENIIRLMKRFCLTSKNEEEGKTVGFRNRWRAMLVEESALDK